MSAVQRGPSASRWMEELPNEINTSYPQPTSELLWGPVPVGSVQAHAAQEAPLSSSTVTYPHVTTPATNPALWELATSSNPSDSAPSLLISQLLMKSTLPMLRVLGGAFHSNKQQKGKKKKKHYPSWFYAQTASGNSLGSKQTCMGIRNANSTWWGRRHSCTEPVHLVRLLRICITRLRFTLLWPLSWILENQQKMSCHVQSILD